jgi:transcription termination/antitermination protein NusG
VSISPLAPFAFRAESPAVTEPATGWFAISTYPKHERKTAEHLPLRGVETFLPTYTVKRRWKNRQTVSLSLPLFPGYLFGRFAKAQRTAVLSLHGVIGIIGGAQQTSTVPEHYIETLRTAVDLGRILPFPEPVIGDHVRITCGPLAGVEGLLAHINSEFRVVISIQLIRQPASIIVSRDEIEPVHGHDFRIVD